MLSPWRAAFFEYTASVRSRFHRFLLVLLMLALPLQGLALASMVDAALASDPGAAEQLAANAGTTPACHETEEPDAPPAQHDCRHCAACVLASALPILASTVPALPAARGFASRHDASFIGFLPDGPERPPRSILA